MYLPYACAGDAPITRPMSVCSRCNRGARSAEDRSIALPLARDCLATIGPKSKDEELLPRTVELCNRLQVEGAHRYVYYHPGGRLKAFAQECLGTATGQ